MTDQEKLKEIVGKWQSAHYLSEAILYDYAAQMSKVTGELSENIVSRVRESAKNKMLTDRK